MNWKKWQIPAAIVVGVLLGVGITNYRSLLPESWALAQGGQPKKEKGEPGGIFSPPGTSDTGPVTPPPGDPPFKGKIGRTISESTPDWPPLARAAKGAPNVLFIVLDD